MLLPVRTKIQRLEHLALPLRVTPIIKSGSKKEFFFLGQIGMDYGVVWLPWQHGTFPSSVHILPNYFSVTAEAGPWQCPNFC